MLELVYSSLNWFIYSIVEYTIVDPRDGGRTSYSSLSCLVQIIIYFYIRIDFNISRQKSPKVFKYSCSQFFIILTTYCICLTNRERYGNGLYQFNIIVGISNPIFHCFYQKCQNNTKCDCLVSDVSQFLCKSIIKHY